jgi:hypothetical protein
MHEDGLVVEDLDELIENGVAVYAEEDGEYYELNAEDDEDDLVVEDLDELIENGVAVYIEEDGEYYELNAEDVDEFYELCEDTDDDGEYYDEARGSAYTIAHNALVLVKKYGADASVHRIKPGDYRYDVIFRTEGGDEKKTYQIADRAMRALGGKLLSGPSKVGDTIVYNYKVPDVSIARFIWKPLNNHGVLSYND